MYTQKTLFAFFTPDPKTRKGSTPPEEKKTISPIHKSKKRAFMREQNKEDYDRTHQWDGYLFTATNNFTEYSVVNTVPKTDATGKIAVAPGITIATATVDDDSALTHIEVHSDFRRQKIGTELIRFIKNACPQFVVFGGTEHNSRYRLTTEGGALITYCEKKGILKTTQVIRDSVPTSPSYEY